MVKRLRILHAPADVAGQATGLSDALRRLGHESRALTFKTPRFGYRSDENLKLERFRVPIQYLIRLWYFLRNATRYDIFHFYFGESLLPWNLDLPILKFLGKRLFMTYQGCDIRLQNAEVTVGGVTHSIHHTCVCNAIPDQKKKAKVRFVHRYAEKTYVLNPDLLFSDPRAEMLPYTHLDPNAWPMRTRETRGTAPLRVVHAPSDRALKGTSHVLDAVERLKKSGYGIDLILIEGLSHDQMQEHCRDADLAIDQLIIGWYGGFSVEMMALGIPVLCYLDSRFSALVPFFHELPIINTSAHNLTSTLKALCDDRSVLPALSVRSRKFVEHVHDPLAIAKRLISDYANAY